MNILLLFQDQNSRLWWDISFFSSNALQAVELLRQRCWTLKSQCDCATRALPGEKASRPETAGGDVSVWMKVDFFFNGNLARPRHRGQLQSADGARPSTFNLRTNVEFVRNPQAGDTMMQEHTGVAVLCLYSAQPKTRQTKATAEVQNHQAKSQNPGTKKQKTETQVFLQTLNHCPRRADKVARTKAWLI